MESRDRERETKIERERDRERSREIERACSGVPVAVYLSVEGW